MVGNNKLRHILKGKSCRHEEKADSTTFPKIMSLVVGSLYGLVVNVDNPIENTEIFVVGAASEIGLCGRDSKMLEWWIRRLCE